MFVICIDEFCDKKVINVLEVKKGTRKDKGKISKIKAGILQSSIKGVIIKVEKTDDLKRICLDVV